jgi:hypothetical protein
MLTTTTTVNQFRWSCSSSGKALVGEEEQYPSCRNGIRLKAHPAGTRGLRIRKDEYPTRRYLTALYQPRMSCLNLPSVACGYDDTNTGPRPPVRLGRSIAVNENRL